jgi:hypothetical protein
MVFSVLNSPLPMSVTLPATCALATRRSSDTGIETLGLESQSAAKTAALHEAWFALAGPYRGRGMARILPLLPPPQKKLISKSYR